MPASTDNHREMTTLKAPHPAVLLLLWGGLVVAVQSLHAMALLTVSSMLAVAALKLSASRFHTLLRRTRWIMFSLLLIYGYATPGSSLWSDGSVFIPTVEGLADGMLQLARLVAALAALSIVLAKLSQQQLLGGLYVLAYPLRYLGLSRERFAVRLALTLRYAESAMVDATAGWRGSIERLLEPVASVQDEVELHASPLTLGDGLLLAVAIMFVVLL